MTPRRHRAVGDIRRLAAHALRQGAELRSPVRVEWDVSGDCQEPRFVLLWGRPEGRPKRITFSTWEEWTAAIERQSVHDGSMSLEMWTPCRRCGPCLRRRSAHWRLRAQAELAAARRTWFGTLTMRPQAHFQMEARARSRLIAGGTSWSALAGPERFKELSLEGGRELTLWLKRVRKESGVPLRYLLVTEAHKTGLPHWHCLVHEASGDPVTWETLASQWPHGFTKFKLVPEGEPKVAAYVCKYLSKAALSRVRASTGYGRL